MKDDKPIVLDSWAVLAYFNGEAPAADIANLISDAKENGIPLLMSVVNVGEVWYIIARRISPSDADEALDLLDEFGIRFIEVDIDLARVAASFKVSGNISYADCYAAALAEKRNAILITGDQEFTQFEERIKIHFMG
ncbi:MAG TPA: type II toxin-antitoxin system VapC family toxin [Pyrinomonadaceae bacterium]|nr:type II toxin-antitoxin system VapC family toxin [Pyrinomonadaceae bacterium]